MKSGPRKCEGLEIAQSDSIEGSFNKYEYGRILSSGMIGNTYVAKGRDDISPGYLYCIKRMMGKALAEKSLFASVRRELTILGELSDSPGCARLVDIV